MDLLKRLPMPTGMDKSEIIDMLLREEYGYLPSDNVTVSADLVKTDDDFCAGRAELRTIKLTVKGDFGEFSFPVYYTCLTGNKKSVPCFLHINFRDNVPDKYQPTEEIVDNGYAVVSFCYTDVTSDDDDFSNGLAGVIYPEGRKDITSCGKIGLWAWAAMRVMDYVQTLSEIDSERVTVVGHSRLGKTALLTGALDERFYCAVSNNSGCGGASLSREKDGETLEKIYNRFGYWFCENFKKYINCEDDLPFDQHYLLAANYPHMVYVASASEDLWACPKNEYLSCVAVSSYFESKGTSGFVHPNRLPEPGEAFHDGFVGYHLSKGKHYLGRYDWKKFIEFLGGK